MSRAELVIQYLNRWSVNCQEMSGKRGVQTDKMPERGQKRWQRIELGIHGLKSWGRNWSTD
ncbi:MAG: hypothetical protein ACXVBB_02685, partial [Isosphaeraceae bacterium]